eukprot:scaffold17342_cov130-Isochrysis_galbana.AAC.6
MVWARTSSHGRGGDGCNSSARVIALRSVHPPLHQSSAVHWCPRSDSASITCRHSSALESAPCRKRKEASLRPSRPALPGTSQKLVGIVASNPGAETDTSAR